MNSSMRSSVRSSVVVPVIPGVTAVRTDGETATVLAGAGLFVSVETALTWLAVLGGFPS
jgi:ADP-heptose:LPS heptosyltransferase